MPTWRYTGIDGAGKDVRGSLDAESAAAARRKLHASGTYPVEVVEYRPSTRSAPSLLGRQDLLPLLTRQLSTLVGAGVPVVSALTSAATQVDSPDTRATLLAVRDSVQEGTTLARAMEGHPAFFPELYTAMVRAGEEGGLLPVALGRLADHLETQAKTRGRVRSALAYPLFMALVAFLVVVFLLAFVVPRIVGIFTHMKQALPLPTRILIAVSDVLAAWWWLFLAVAFALAIAWRRYVATPPGALRRDTLMLRLPLAGRVVHLSALSRFARTLSALIAGGLPVDRALRIVSPVIGNRLLSDRVAAAAARVVEGASLSDSFRGFPEFPPTMIQMVAAGEESGRLDFILTKLADSLDGEVEARTGRLLSLLEPVIILVMGGIVASIVLSVMLPLLEVSQIVK